VREAVLDLLHTATSGWRTTSKQRHVVHETVLPPAGPEEKRMVSRYRSVAGYLVLSLPVIMFWCTYWNHLALRTQLVASHGESDRPPLVSGLVVNLQSYVHPVLQRPARSGLYSLVIVFSDRCLHSRREMHAWRRFLESTSPQPTVNVVLVSRSGDEISNQLASAARLHGWTYQQVRVRDSALFAERTGIAWSPELLVLDPKSRVRIATERLTPRVQALLRDLMDESRLKDR